MTARTGFAIAAAAVAAALLVTQSTSAQAQQTRPERINERPNINGIWQAMDTAYWNLEAHAAQAIEDWWELGALGAIKGGKSVVVGGTIPYLPEALEQRERNRAGYPESDPVTKCYMPGIPRANYMPFPFEIVQGDGDILFVYSFAVANRNVHMNPDEHLTYEEVPVDQWMGWSNGHWEGDTLVIDVMANDARTWLDRAGNHHSNAMRVTERFTPMREYHMRYEATIDDPNTFSRPWTISMPLYRRAEPDAELIEYRCVPFSEPLLYGEYLKEPIE